MPPKFNIDAKNTNNILLINEGAVGGIISD